MRSGALLINNCKYSFAQAQLLPINIISRLFDKIHRFVYMHNYFSFIASKLKLKVEIIFGLSHSLFLVITTKNTAMKFTHLLVTNTYIHFFGYNTNRISRE